MANTAGVCSSFRKELLQGVHAFGTPPVRAAATKDVFKVALYLSTASITPATAAYSATGEVSGTGYTAGGVIVANTVEPLDGSNVGYWTPSGVVTFAGVTIGPFDTALLYNSSQGNKAVAVYKFAEQIITAGSFTLTMPANDPANALVQIG